MLSLAAIPAGFVAWSLLATRRAKTSAEPEPKASPVSGAVDPAGFQGTQTASAHPLGAAPTPGAALGDNPPPVAPSGPLSGGTQWELVTPDPYTPGYGLYDETWRAEQDHAAPSELRDRILLT